MYYFLGTRVWRNRVFYSSQVYHFLDIRVWQNRVFYGTQVLWKNFENFLWYSSFMNLSTIKKFSENLKYIFFQRTRVFGTQVS